MANSGTYTTAAVGAARDDVELLRRDRPHARRVRRRSHRARELTLDCNHALRPHTIARLVLCLHLCWHRASPSPLQPHIAAHPIAEFSSRSADRWRSASCMGSCVVASCHSRPPSLHICTAPAGSLACLGSCSCSICLVRRSSSFQGKILTVRGRGYRQLCWRTARRRDSECDRRQLARGLHVLW